MIPIGFVGTLLYAAFASMALGIVVIDPEMKMVFANPRSFEIVGHRKEILGLYLGALMIPGVVAFVLPGRLMNVMLMGW